MSVDKKLSAPLNRREFLKKAGLMSGSIALSSSLFLRCAGDEPQPTPVPGDAYVPRKLILLLILNQNIF